MASTPSKGTSGSHINIDRVTTGRGDKGQTALGDWTYAPKSGPLIEAIGSIDETNSAIGVILQHPTLPDEVASELRSIQNDLFDVSGDLSYPMKPDEEGKIRVTDEYVKRLEGISQRFNADLGPLRSFLLPGGPHGAAELFFARAVARRAERAVWTALESGPDTVNELAAKYLNRLSDVLFVLSRWVQRDSDQTIWIPEERDRGNVRQRPPIG